MDNWPWMRLVIGRVVDSRVRPLWDEWADGGRSSIEDLTKDFGTDFTASPTTAETTDFLVSEIKKELTTSPPAVSGRGSRQLDISNLIPGAVKAIDVPNGAHEMNFNVPGDIPGNLAGGIGKDEAAHPIGKHPSPQDDERIVKGDVTISDSGSNLLVSPKLHYTVKDTVDLCPGDCGTLMEQQATVTMSRWEATGISGDVPFTVDFPAPSAQMLPFIISKSTVPPAPHVPAPAIPSKPPHP